MLQMSSCTQLNELAPAVRPHEGRLVGEGSSGASSDTAEDVELPECRIKRNYTCTKCTFYTQNPRAFLIHKRTVHLEKFKIYDCLYCAYASRQHQKLVRHTKMVHGSSDPQSVVLSNGQLESSHNEQADMLQHFQQNEPLDMIHNSQRNMVIESMHNMQQSEDIERMEDMVEEVEESQEMDLDIEESIEECIEQVVETEGTDDPPPASGKKDKFFSCSKCNYVTHIRSRYTKHVKYHSMPMIKCTICDFRTPYKWNLDRHMRNHGGTGGFHCFMCNFTADIKQSLTVHEMNHHTPPAGSGQSPASRRRNRVGASDSTAALIKEEEGSGDSRSSQSATDIRTQEADIELVSCNSDSNDANMVSEERGELRTAHDNTNEDNASQKQNKKPPRPIPQLIPLGAATPTQSKTPSNTGEPPKKKFKESPTSDGIEDSKQLDNLPAGISLIPIKQTPTPKETIVRKKNESFFDKLKERLLTETSENGSLICKNCGFKSKCLSEHSVHEKNCIPNGNKVPMSASLASKGSTRCQHCRHRCKSSADLHVHLQTCGQAQSNRAEPVKKDNYDEPSTSTAAAETEPHPMENVVFVWNNFSQDPNKFEMPLDISINDDATLPEISFNNYDSENVDENDGLILSPTQAKGKNVFKCPRCPFWASTASRFHVHIVGHLNKKPFECSLCKYKSNWRWDITKHIKLKTARDPGHSVAKVIMTDETGRRNYSKYTKFLAVPVVNEDGENELIYVDQEAATTDSAMDIDEPVNESLNYDMHPMNLHTQNDQNRVDPTKPKRTLWKCKKCNYKDPSKEALLDHVREHSKSQDGLNDDRYLNGKKLENVKDPSELAYRCGHCNQLSNWKHVIQRHCRLKHDGVIKVDAIERPKTDVINAQTHIAQEAQLESSGDFCNKCPFKATDKKQLAAHLLQHVPSAQSIFKCYFCPFFVKTEQELFQHLSLHGISDPEEYTIAKSLEGKCINEQTLGNKRHKCTECPYETNSKSQYMYHEQFHRLPADTPYKCPECNYSVSKRHLLHQHLRVHGIFTKRNEADLENEASTSTANIMSDDTMDHSVEYEDISYVWVSAKNEFHKMYKCRYCSYVNSQKCKIPNHEKIHCISTENSEVTMYKCLECKFTCDLSSRLSDHSKTHGEIYGRIYCPVDLNIPDEEQVKELRKIVETEKMTLMANLVKDETKDNEEEILYFCQKCPARFLKSREMKLHELFHDSTFNNNCTVCEFSVTTESELASHLNVHTDDYQCKTRTLKSVHDTHPQYKEPKLELKTSTDTSEALWVVPEIPKKIAIQETTVKKSEVKTPKQYSCKECPAKFFKNSALSYHMGLHGGEGEHKCKKCSYAVKNVGNLAKHELLHETENKNLCDYESGDDIDYKNIPLSGTDLFQRKTEAQKRVLTDKSKLVKPNDHFPPVLQADPQFGYLMHGNPEFIYPTYLKNGRQKEKRYKCHKCPSAFEKREQYKIHLSLHGSKQRYKCELCDYSVKYYANYVQHMRKHQMNDEAQAERKKGNESFGDESRLEVTQEDSSDNIKLAIKTMPKPPPKSDFQLFSVSDQQTLRLLQRRRSIVNSTKDCKDEQSPIKDRKLHMCTRCPYTNQRNDALVNHQTRHRRNDVSNAGCNKCPHCDLAVVQSNFLRDHLKTHFSYQKHITAQCYSANEDVSFEITEKDENERDILISKIDLKTSSNDVYRCIDNKIVVLMSTGEIVVD